MTKKSQNCLKKSKNETYLFLKKAKKSMTKNSTKISYNLIKLKKN
jgi:hypothetical protein